MKKVKIGFVLVVVISLSFILAGHLYTKEKVENFGNSLGYFSFSSTVYSPPGSPNSKLTLGRLLSVNMGIIGDEFITYENDKIQNKWRDLIASDPSLGYTAFDLYSSSFVTNFKSSFQRAKDEYILYYTENPDDQSEEQIRKAQMLDANSYLKNSVESMKLYQNLIDELLKLDDATLNRYIKSISKDPCCFYSETEQPIEATELRKWLVSKSFIPTSAEAEMPWVTMYPTDLILLTNRVSSNYPKWTNRKFLQEAKKFSIHVQKNLKY